MNKEELSYRKAVEEMEEILDQIERGEMDLDDLSVKVARVSELLKYCNDRLQQTQKRVSEILDENQEEGEA